MTLHPGGLNTQELQQVNMMKGSINQRQPLNNMGMYSAGSGGNNTMRGSQTGVLTNQGSGGLRLNTPPTQALMMNSNNTTQTNSNTSLNANREAQLAKQGGGSSNTQGPSGMNAVNQAIHGSSGKGSMGANRKKRANDVDDDSSNYLIDLDKVVK
jgi:hypothetical protein